MYSGMPHGILTHAQDHTRFGPDLLIAAVAERNVLTVLHCDQDFDLIPQVTGQPREWAVPAEASLDAVH
jgi:predicted nucleic acid-binding protein